MNSIDTEDFIAKRYEVLVERDVRYGEAMVDHGTTPRMRPLLLDIYRPQAAPVMARPALVLAFGGAFHRGSRQSDTVIEDGHENTPVSAYCHEFARRGYVCFSIDYRLTPEDPHPGNTPLLLNPMNVNRDRIDFVRGIMGLPPSTPVMIANAMEAAIDDMGTAIDWVHAQAGTLGVNPQQIAAGGFSAGAMMALAATYGQQSPAAAVVALSGAMGLAEMHRYIRSADAPPALLFRGENDLPGIGPISHELHLHMQSVGVDHESYVVADGTHFYPRTATAMPVMGDSTSTLEDAMAAFLCTRMVAPDRRPALA
ncbi:MULTISPECIES: alpha/beta hydrolase [unclassified Variovorax]|uniref:alpha/beta hydrolase n=1 Tax=unclassified Variovorax TaxID=663243 RepID=UPI002B23C1DD|nr:MULTISPECIES: alpha/beta hydrolase [unclassified Variovorax]MEB0058621.1 alpha/beta hydrolase [Variovorax sp. LG9.2]MEB0112098.1 alpha/beta hydrolase [Variovorax sp. RTB1]